MRDYAELIKTLRYCNEYDNCGSRCPRFESNGDGDCVDGLMKDAADAIEELLAELTTIRKQLPRWISVEERFPKKKVGDEGYVGYLVLSDGEYQIADFTHDKYMQTAYEFHVDGEYDPNVTHWMELPPKGVE